MSGSGAEDNVLLHAVSALRAQVANSTLPLEIPQTQTAKTHREALLHQLDDYVLPRLSSLDAPLLAVIGGSTGAGKSTLVNSVVDAEVSRSGILRPTTTTPVLVHHPRERRWFEGDRILPGLSRLTGAASGDAGPGSVRLVASSALPPGMALLDAPDIDSVVSANRALASQLLAAADLWLFVTTAARYADAVPWGLLREASDRGTAVAIVLDRVPPEAMTEIRAHLASMLREQGLATAPIFGIPETSLTPEGRLPEGAVTRLKSWLSALASDARARASIVKQTLGGALDSLESRTGELVEASEHQHRAALALRGASEQAYAAALEGVAHGITDGTLLRGEVLARWQEFVGTGEFFKQVESAVARMRDRITAAVKGAPAPSSDLGEALQTGVAALISAQAQSAATTAARAWRTEPGGAPLLAEHPELAKASPGLAQDIDRLVRDWQGEVLDLVRSEGRDRRTTARIAAYGVNGIGVILMLVAFAHTGGLVGAEVGIAGGTAVLAQKVLEAIFGDQAVREMAAKARKRLLERVEELYAAERARFDKALAGVEVDSDQATRLADAAAAVKAVR
ncbi:GTPase domain-containing protein [Phycicoccus sp. SLBN-51]|uniref:GTPase domain-containing protein n=1 Tax=Phycicoccus sp. SLBN-51 TaxID=2768447 RepID=UPI00114EE7C5|nr:GTPase domain-containing protein [Phycicoccus sp. SLBN-51]TQJ51480.1 dynamin family protein [Phycicoccus sp. SLBN-51]